MEFCINNTDGKIFIREKQYKINGIIRQSLKEEYFMKYIQFKPIYKERIWGGRRLEEAFGRRLPDMQLYGESWEIVDREGDQSVVVGGVWDGFTLRELIREENEYIMGPAWDWEKPFPILVKWLDCRERLSLQVHPPKEVANLLGGESKTENWYIAESDFGSSIFAGVKKGVSAEKFEKAMEEEGLEGVLCEIAVEKGDSIFIPSGRLHAIGGGNLILEVQENSDTTYRVHDWGRVGLDGKPRQMHIEQSIASIDFEDVEPVKTSFSKENCILVDCGEFRIQKIVMGGGAYKIEGGEGPCIISVVEGSLRISDEEGTTSLVAGSNVLLPFGESFVLEGGDSVVLMTDRFCEKLEIS